MAGGSIGFYAFLESKGPKIWESQRLSRSGALKDILRLILVNLCVLSDSSGSSHFLEASMLAQWGF